MREPAQGLPIEELGAGKRPLDSFPSEPMIYKSIIDYDMRIVIIDELETVCTSEYGRHGDNQAE